MEEVTTAIGDYLTFVRSSLKVGIVGCGTISPAYVRELSRHPVVELVLCADLDPARASRLEQELGVPAAATPEALLDDPEVDLVLNLTVPAAHAEVSLAAIAHGKHVYSEKPLAATLEDGRRVLQAAERAGIRVGCAPDTFLSAPLQKCRRLVDEGAIGEPVAAAAFFANHGHECWHPAPDFYYQPGGGPMLDMGPYYLTALVSLVGPIARVNGSARASFAERVIGSGPRRGETIAVRTPTHVAGVVDFVAGAVGTLVMSFDVWGSTLPWIEVYGTAGSLAVPDPNVFAGPVRLWHAGSDGWADVEVSAAPRDRGVGVADLAAAVLEDRPHRASGELALHILEVMTAFERSSVRGEHVRIETAPGQPAPLEAGA